ncbi:polyprenyl diphosphate synthase [Inhella gelatinilytica]|uniref:Isoprenyl transferase n=1 Tax=Inhella gelatinilytica TaxID=2795030 RepID=A0A931NE78_9BURK|nr:polyprenyl diphosphate synthase [Inhella gelatinilytica]MBH9553399.1 di-trans,poly-cis-decaprenylcistransferase [Inhella gelatinilytica]
MPAEALAGLPRHVAIVMDGNGRWAKKRFLPRFFGHKAGVDAVVRVIQGCLDRDIPILTVFAFSSENWKRSDEEISGLMGLVLAAISRYLVRLGALGVKVRVIGDRDAVSAKLRQAWDDAEAATAHNDKLLLQVAFNYGGRWDIAQACRRAMADGVEPAALTEDRLARYMALAPTPDPDLFIRTGGEQRLSNFLLWQAAYSELVFTDRLWPDFGADDLDAAIRDFQGRERRFGGLKESR